MVAGTRAFKVPESVLVVIHTAQLDVLLIERADAPGFWQSVTGSLASVNELPRETAVREVQEETGLDCSPTSALGPALRDWQLHNIYDIYPQWLHRYAPGVTRNVEHVFGLCVPAVVPVRLSPREHSAQCWLPWRAAADWCFSPSNAEAILLLPRFVGA